MSENVQGHQVADDVFVFAGTAVNWVLIREGTELTLVDAGWRGDTDQVERSIRSLGRKPEDLRAVILTHAHADHTGALNHLHDTYGVPLYMDSAEVPNAVGTVDESGGPLDVAKIIYRPRVALWAARIVSVGALRHVTVPDAQAFPRADGAQDDGAQDDGALDLPGRPVPVATPGHTSGHTSYLLPSVGVLISGDALVTAHPTLPDVGPRLLPGFFSNDQGSAVRALSTLRGIDADILVPGHGPTWNGPISASADEALEHVGDR